MLQFIYFLASRLQHLSACYVYAKQTKRNYYDIKRKLVLSVRLPIAMILRTNRYGYATLFSLAALETRKIKKKLKLI